MNLHNLKFNSICKIIQKRLINLPVVTRIDVKTNLTDLVFNEISVMCKIPSFFQGLVEVLVHTGPKVDLLFHLQFSLIISFESYFDGLLIFVNLTHFLCSEEKYIILYFEGLNGLGLDLLFNFLSEEKFLTLQIFFVLIILLSNLVQVYHNIRASLFME